MNVMAGKRVSITTCVRLLMVAIAAMWLPLNCCCVGMNAALASGSRVTEQATGDSSSDVSVALAHASCCSGGSSLASAMSGDTIQRDVITAHHQHSHGSQPCGKECSAPRVSRAMPSSPIQVPAASDVFTLLPAVEWQQIIAPSTSFRAQFLTVCDLSSPRTLLAQHCALTT